MLSSFEFADHVVGILIQSNMDQNVFREVRRLIKAKIAEFQKINLFLEIEKGHEISMLAVVKHLKFSVEYADLFKKIAVVTEKGSFKNALMIKDLLIDA